MRDKIRKKVRHRKKGTVKHLPTKDLELIAFWHMLGEQTREERRPRKTRTD